MRLENASTYSASGPECQRGPNDVSERSSLMVFSFSGPQAGRRSQADYAGLLKPGSHVPRGPANPTRHNPAPGIMPGPAVPTLLRNRAGAWRPQPGGSYEVPGPQDH